MNRLLCLVSVAVHAIPVYGLWSQAPSEAMRPNRAHAVAIGGGVSMGAYQAGALWAHVALLRGARDRSDSLAALIRRVDRSLSLDSVPTTLDAVAGTSAGAINALLGAHEFCFDSASTDPEKSLFWSAWMPVGIDELLRPWRDERKTTLLSRSRFAGVWNDLWRRADSTRARTKCDVAVGVTLTSFQPMYERADQSLAFYIPNHKHVGALQVAERNGRLRVLRPNHAEYLTKHFTSVLVLPLRARDSGADSAEVSRPDAQAMFEGSSSFPVAFEPRQLTFARLSSLGKQGLVCANAGTATGCERLYSANFVDGGVFDNRPIDVAATLASAPLVDMAKRRDSALEVQRVSALSACKEAAQEALRPRVDALGNPTQYDQAAEQAREAERIGRSDDAVTCARLTKTAAPVAKQGLVDLMFLDDDVLRGSVEREPEERWQTVGIVPSLRFLASAMQSAQQVEALRFGRRISGVDTEQVRVSWSAFTRYHHVNADHLAHFGAFLARPFREHDFLVGVLDGLRAGSERWICDREAGEAKAVCADAILWEVVRGGWLELSPEHRAVLVRLLDYERSPSQLPVREEFKANPLTVLVDLNQKMRRVEQESCRTQAFLIEEPLCDGRFLRFLRDWESGLDSLQGGSPCRRQEPEPDYCEWVRDPRGTYHRLILRVLSRAQAIEAAASAGGGSSMTLVLNAALIAEFAFNEQLRGLFQIRDRSWVDPNPSSATVLPSRWWGVTRILPFHVSAAVEESRHWIEWRPTAYLARFGEWSVAAAAPFSVYRDDMGTRGSVGASAIFYPPVALWSNVAIGRQFAAGPEAGWDISASFVAGTLRAGWRVPTLDGGPALTRKNFYLGVGDANGLSSRVVVWSAKRLFGFLAD